MIQRGEELRFALEAREAIGITGKRFRQDLQGDIALQLRIAGAVHLAHAAGAERAGNLEWAESGAARERHRAYRAGVAGIIVANMKTIAITIDDETLERVDRLGGGRSRSRIIREAVRNHVAQLERLAEEEREAAVIRRHRGRLARQARALVHSQARP